MQISRPRRMLQHSLKLRLSINVTFFSVTLPLLVEALATATNRYPSCFGSKVLHSSLGAFGRYQISTDSVTIHHT